MQLTFVFISQILKTTTNEMKTLCNGSVVWSDGGTWMRTFVWTVLNNAELLLQKCKNTSFKNVILTITELKLWLFEVVLIVEGQVVGNEPGYKAQKHETTPTLIPAKRIVSWTCDASLSFTADGRQHGNREIKHQWPSRCSRLIYERKLRSVPVQSHSAGLREASPGTNRECWIKPWQGAGLQ